MVINYKKLICSIESRTDNLMIASTAFYGSAVIDGVRVKYNNEGRFAIKGSASIIT